MTKILIVDDEIGALESLGKILRNEGYDVATAQNGEAALENLRKEGPANLVLTDLKMDGVDGMEVLKEAKRLAPETEVIMMTAYGTIETAVEAMKEGAYDFIVKPLKRTYINTVVKRALEKQQLVLENIRLRERLRDQMGSSKIIANSPAMREVIDLVQQVTPTSATVLIQGPSGTGKEILANAIHAGSPRHRYPFIKVNCGALPETLLESELFGYEKGAFTGATTRKDGRFDLANGGTLFLDEISETSLAIQVKLLRVLQEGEFDPLGSTKSKKVDVRIIAATNADLEGRVKQGLFREDLFYRLNVFKIPVPSLRERKEDIAPLVKHFLSFYAAKNNRPVTEITQEAMTLLEQFDWPGNVRELENIMERAVILTQGKTITEKELPPNIKSQGAQTQLCFPVGTPITEIEHRMIEETLRYYKGDKTKTAEALGLAQRTLYRRLEEK